MPRAVKEWIAKSDDTKVPPRVRQRCFDKVNGVCHICKIQIKVGETWEADHIIALINGGENRESNLGPVHKHCHVSKTAIDDKIKSKTAKVRGRHTGAIRPKAQLKSKGFAKSPKGKSLAQQAGLNPLPPKQLYGART